MPNEVIAEQTLDQWKNGVQPSIFCPSFRQSQGTFTKVGKTLKVKSWVKDKVCDFTQSRTVANLTY